MAQPYVGQIVAVGFNFAPVGWLQCAGQTLSISEYVVLFQLIGTTYGGNGQTTFNLPNLQGRVPLGQGQAAGLSPYVLGQAAGAEAVTLLQTQLPVHTHQVIGTTAAATSANPANNLTLASTQASVNVFVSATPSVPLAASAIGIAGSGPVPHENRQPFQVINYIIATEGIFPSQS